MKEPAPEGNISWIIVSNLDIVKRHLCLPLKLTKSAFSGNIPPPSEPPRKLTPALKAWSEEKVSTFERDDPVGLFSL
jgi:hypothetical protein